MGSIAEQALRIPGRVVNWLKSHGYHLLFAIALLSLIALIAWWSVFIRNAIEQQRDYHYDSAMDKAKILSLSMGHNQSDQPQIGVMPQDDRLQIARYDPAAHKLLVPLAPFWPELCITPSQDFIAEVEEKFSRQLIMVAGEGSVLFLAVFVSCIMLYQVIRLERRSTKELKSFWNRVTHELKTPITGIKAFLQTLQKQEFTREELEPLVQMALREVERQEMLAENLLVGQRVAREGLGLKIKQFGLVQRVEDFINEHRIIIPAGALKLELDCPEGLKVTGDPDALWVILENLIDNALKYGGDQPRITCRVEATRTHGIVSIRDQGVGFDPADSHKIFDAYQRLTDELPVGRHGTGMGLYISRQLATKMGGRLKAESAGHGNGASFILTLKRVK